jgi:hypothetical protein
MLLINLAFTATDIFGAAEVTDENCKIGFAANSQKSLIQDDERKVSPGPKGLPIRILNNRVEFRGLVMSETISTTNLRVGLLQFHEIMEEFAAFTRGEESNWPALREELIAVLSTTALGEPDMSLQGHIPPEYISGQISRGKLDVMDLLEPKSRLQQYLSGLSAYALYRNVQMRIGREWDKKKTEAFQNCLDAALQDNSFIEFAVHYFGVVPTKSDELMKVVRKYYDENHRFEYEGEKYYTKTWESMRGRIAITGNRDQTFRSRVTDILTVQAA